MNDNQGTNHAEAARAPYQWVRKIPRAMDKGSALMATVLAAIFLADYFMGDGGGLIAGIAVLAAWSCWDVVFLRAKLDRLTDK